MAYPPRKKALAHKLRKAGYSIPRIAKEIHLAKSTVWEWVKDVRLPKILQEQLQNNSVQGRERAWQIIKARNKVRFLSYIKEAKQTLQLLPKQNKAFWKLCAALVYWCEGAKRKLSDVQFANSDPKLVSLFLHALRSGFYIDEKRLSALLHLHEYHHEKKQKLLWSQMTGIPLSQFKKTYWKPHTIDFR